MTSMSFTADSGTDQLTITTHGLSTGAGPVGLYNFDGALPTGTPTIDSATNYWIIAVDANHVKIATSSANAFANVAVDITANGSGTGWLYIGLPTRRNTTYAAGSQVPSVDLNALQDCFKFEKRAPYGRRFYPRLAYPGTTNPFVYFIQSNCPTIASTGNTTDAQVEIPYETGHRLMGLHLWVFGDGAADIQFDMRYQPTPGGSITTLSTLTDTNRTAVFAKLVMPTFTTQVLAEDAVLQLRLTPSAATYQIGPLTAWFDHLG